VLSSSFDCLSVYFLIDQGIKLVLALRNSVENYFFVSLRGSSCDVTMETKRKTNLKDF